MDRLPLGDGSVQTLLSQAIFRDIAAFLQFAGYTRLAATLGSLRLPGEPALRGQFRLAYPLLTDTIKPPAPGNQVAVLIDAPSLGHEYPTLCVTDAQCYMIEGRLPESSPAVQARTRRPNRPQPLKP